MILSLNKREVVSISSKDTDYYQCGLNCLVLGYDPDVSQNCLDAFPHERDDEDLFWEGYYSEEVDNLDKIFSSLDLYS